MLQLLYLSHVVSLLQLLKEAKAEAEISIKMKEVLRL